MGSYSNNDTLIILLILILPMTIFFVKFHQNVARTNGAHLRLYENCTFLLNDHVCPSVYLKKIKIVIFWGAIFCSYSFISQL